MKEKLPENYEPGELGRTRRNLGEVTDDEARRMTKLLGGEVGIERTNDLVSQKYDRLRDLNRRRSDRILPPSRVKRAYSEYLYEETSPDRNLVVDRLRPSYLARVKINFLAARSEYGIKSIFGAVATLFSLLFRVREYINPKFIIEGDEIFFRHIERLVLSVRGLLALNQKHPANRIRNPFFVRILSVIRDWDIEGLHQELTHLQIAPRHLSFHQCESLAKKIFAPLIQLIDVAEGNSINSSLKRLYDLNMLSLPKTHPDISRIKSYFNDGSVKMQYVFRILKRTCYPLLMITASTGYAPVGSFYLSKRPEILAFLGLKDDDILQIPGEPEIEQKDSPEEIEEVLIEPTVKIEEMPSLQKGFEILERLFPSAGWNSLEEFPDLYPYFQPLMMFPRGFELVPPSDPLHQVVVLASILQEFFYGFRAVEFGTIRRDGGKSVRIWQLLDSLTDRWRQFLVELVSQHYLTTLYEYCREVEKSPHFGESVYGSKQRTYLAWLKKTYVLPHLTIGRPKPGEVIYAIPKLHELTRELSDILSAVAQDLADSDQDSPKTTKNPWSRFAFEIESEVSRRFREVLNLYHEETNNANLLLYTYAMLLLLDAMLNEQASHFYPYNDGELYRREAEDSSVPMYSVPIADPLVFFRAADEEVELAEMPAELPEQNINDQLTEMLNARGLRMQVDQLSKISREQKLPFVILSVLIRDFSEICLRNGEEAGISILRTASRVIRSAIREYKDIPARTEEPLFMVILPGTIREESVNLAIRLFVAFQELDDPDIKVSIGIVQQEKAWGREKLLKVAGQAAREAESLPPPSLCVYDPKKNEYKTLREVHQID